MDGDEVGTERERFEDWEGRGQELRAVFDGIGDGEGIEMGEKNVVDESEGREMSLLFVLQPMERVRIVLLGRCLLVRVAAVTLGIVDGPKRTTRETC